VTVATTPRTLHVVGISGSLRRASFNSALLLAARELAPPELIIEVHELGSIPLFNLDLETDGAPVGVEELRGAVRRADGLLLVTPEYNHGVPGVLKNAIDWLSQPRQAFVLTNSPVMQQPEVLVGRAHEKFDAAGRLTDQLTREFVAEFLKRLAQWLVQQERARLPD
jgi:chromate reductase